MNIDEIDLIAYMELVRDNWDAIHAIKEHLANMEVNEAKGVLMDFPERLRIALWRAPSKGGVFTTEERGLLKS